MTIQLIALDRLVPASDNVRKTNAGQGIEQLAASIKAHGLLQNLQVRERPDGKHEVVAGGRRLAALRWLAKHKAIAKDFPVPCAVLDASNATEISLAENEMRQAMHPADQFEAFHALALAGSGADEIAARFGVTPHIVRQRLKLAAVSPKLMQLYRDGAMSLDQLMAFTVSDDHTAQQTAWFDAPEFNRHPSTIRRALTAGNVDASDKRVRFVTLDAYLAAGGGIIRDLFQPHTEGYLTDPALLDRMVAEKLEKEAETVRAEGWKWVEIMPTVDYGSLARFDHIQGETQPYPAKQQKALEKLHRERDRLCEIDEDAFTEADRQTLEAIEDEIDNFPPEPRLWDAENLARCGAILSIGHSGAVQVERGLLRPEDKAKPAAPDGKAPEDKPAAPGLSSALVVDMTAHRTAALQAALATSPAVGLRLVTHALALDVFYSQTGKAASCLKLRMERPSLAAKAEGIKTSRAAKALADRAAFWTKQLPKKPGDLWDWLAEQRVAVLEDVLACCVAHGVTALHDGKSGTADDRRAEDRLAEALDLDMRQWWQPTEASYFGRVPKALILAAVREAVSPMAAADIADLKKDALAARAAKAVAGTGWLPPLLRGPNVSGKPAKVRAKAGRKADRPAPERRKAA